MSKPAEQPDILPGMTEMCAAMRKHVNGTPTAVDWLERKSDDLLCHAGSVKSNLGVSVRHPVRSLKAGIPLIRKHKMEKVLAEISKVPQGKVLVELARQHDLPVRLRMSLLWPGGAGFYKIKQTRNGKVPSRIGISIYSPVSEIVIATIHELRHHQQWANGLLDLAQRKPVSGPIETLWYTRATEADAESTAVDIAYHLKIAGHPEVWDSYGTDDTCVYSQIKKAYMNAIYKDPRGAYDGCAKRAAFDKWFDARFHGGQTLPGSYNDNAIEIWSPGVVRETFNDAAKYPHKYAQGFKDISPDDIRQLGMLDAPHKLNYLDIRGGRALDDMHYRQPHLTPSQGRRLARLNAKHAQILRNAIVQIKKEKAEALCLT